MKHGMCGDNIHHRQTQERIRLVQRHTMRRPSASIMADDMKLLKAQMAHQQILILSKTSKCIIAVIGQAGWFA